MPPVRACRLAYCKTHNMYRGKYVLNTYVLGGLNVRGAVVREPPAFNGRGMLFVGLISVLRLLSAKLVRWWVWTGTRMICRKNDSSHYLTSPIGVTISDPGCFCFQYLRYVPQGQRLGRCVRIWDLLRSQSKIIRRLLLGTYL